MFFEKKIFTLMAPWALRSKNRALSHENETKIVKITHSARIPLAYLWDGLELLDKKVKEMNTMLIFC